MISAGIVAEYNPFHNGHKYHIEKTREITGAECIIVIMSGDFTQRGEPAIADKYTRTRCAISAGADIVIELPCRYALSSAEMFASGSVSLLEAMKADYISFGSECGNLDILSQLAHLLADETPEYKSLLAKFCSEGSSYAAARMKALAEIFPEAAGIIDNPNNILATEYLKAIISNRYSIKPITITRNGIGYNDTYIKDGMNASASSIRALLDNGSYDISKTPGTPSISSIKPYVPESVYDILRDSYNHCFPVYTDDFSSLFYYKTASLINENVNLSSFSDVSDAMANRLAKNINPGLSISQTALLLKTKNIAYSRIMRSFMHILLNHHAGSNINDSYLRILGFNNTGRKYISQNKGNFTAPLITKPADYASLIRNDVFASSVYNRIVYEKYGNLIKDDFRHELIINL